MTTDRTEAGFWAAMGADPDDDLCRLAYADWLDGAGDPKAELIRVSVAASRAKPWSADAVILKAHEQALLATVGREWTDPFYGQDVVPQFERGGFTACGRSSKLAWFADELEEVPLLGVHLFWTPEDKTNTESRKLFDRFGACRSLNLVLDRKVSFARKFEASLLTQFLEGSAPESLYHFGLNCQSSLTPPVNQQMLDAFRANHWPGLRSFLCKTSSPTIQEGIIDDLQRLPIWNRLAKLEVQVNSPGEMRACLNNLALTDLSLYMSGRSPMPQTTGEIAGPVRTIKASHSDRLHVQRATADMGRQLKSFGCVGLKEPLQLASEDHKAVESLDLGFDFSECCNAPHLLESLQSVNMHSGFNAAEFLSFVQSLPNLSRLKTTTLGIARGGEAEIAVSYLQRIPHLERVALTVHLDEPSQLCDHIRFCRELKVLSLSPSWDSNSWEGVSGLYSVLNPDVIAQCVALDLSRFDYAGRDQWAEIFIAGEALEIVDLGTANDGVDHPSVHPSVLAFARHCPNVKIIGIGEDADALPPDQRVLDTGAVLVNLDGVF